MLRLFLATTFFLLSLSFVDRFFFTHNCHFSIHSLYSSLPYDPKWDTVDSSVPQQTFRYLGKGNRCTAFVSEDNRFVLKFHRIPATARPFSWLIRPFHLFQTIPHTHLYANWQSYRDALLLLQEETALYHLHLNRSKNKYPTVTLIDSLHSLYKVPLDQTAFLLQPLAKPIYPTLDSLIETQNWEGAKTIISYIVDLLQRTCAKGFIQADSFLNKNYGLLEDRAIFIDVGDLRKFPGIEKKENALAYIKKTTNELRSHIAQYPELLKHYEELLCPSFPQES